MARLVDTLEALDRLVTRERVRAYALILLVAFFAAAGWWFSTLRDGLDAQGKPFGADFIIFYAASDLALQGKAALAYVPAQILAAEQAAVAASRGLFLWCYPPTFQLIITPLALLPYRAAYVLWVTATFALYLLTVRRISRDRLVLLLACAFPAVFMNAIQGQNGFLSAGLMGSGLLLLDRRPLVAGLLLGLLAYKPHLGVLLPLLLVGTGRWRAVLGAALASTAFVAASWLAFGTQAWLGFLDFMPQVSANLASGALDWAKIPTVFIALRSLGAPVAVAYAVHALAGIVIAGVTLVAWRRKGPLAPKAALAVLATLIVVPYAFDYDLAMLAIPLGLMAERLKAGRGPAGAQTAVAVAYLAPIAMLAPAKLLGVQLGPLALLAAFWAAWRMASPAPIGGGLSRDENDASLAAVA